MASQLVAGVDCSTQGTKVIVVDSGSGRIVASGRAAHPVTGAGGARETDPRAWWTALRDALEQTGRAGDVQAISVAGQQHGLVVLDVQCEPLRPAVLWNDTRSAPDADALVESMGGPGWWASAIGSVPAVSFTVTRWAWLRRVEPAVADATHAVRLPHDYMTERLTGQAVTERSDASGTGWWSSVTGDYADEVIDRVALDKRALPAVLGPFERAGRVASRAARDLGLVPGTLVGPGMGDNAGAALGLGMPAGEPVISLGTSGTAYLVSTRPATDPSGLVAGFADASGQYLPLACTMNCTLVVDRFAAWLGLDRDAVVPSAGVTALPWLDGERTPYVPAGSGTVHGLSHDTAPGSVLMAVYEAAAAFLIEALDALDEHSSGIRPDAPLVLVGGGSRGATWREVCARMSGRPLLIPESGEHVALGAAVQAACVLTGTPAAEIATAWRTRDGAQVDPVPRDVETLDRIRRAMAAVQRSSA